MTIGINWKAVWAAVWGAVWTQSPPVAGSDSGGETILIIGRRRGRRGR